MLSPSSRFRLSQCPHPALIRHKMSQSALLLTVMQSALERHSNSIFLLFQAIQLLPLSSAQTWKCLENVWDEGRCHYVSQVTIVTL